MFDYQRILSKTGWKVSHRIERPLSSERMMRWPVMAFFENQGPFISDFMADIEKLKGA